MKLPHSYGNLLNNLKREIKTARIKAHLAVNKELLLLYWKIGKLILEQQEKESWGSKVIERISDDLRKEFPEMTGFSSVNLKRMRLFALEYSGTSIRSQPVTQLPWGHIQVLLFKIKDQSIREWYAQKTLEHGWSRSVLSHQIKTNLYERGSKSLTNFSSTLPKPQSDLALQLVKDPYNLEFLNVESELAERQLENKLIQNIRDFLLELGAGFAFIGNQYKLSLGEEDYYLDLLFYHIKLKCYVVIELKTGKFKPEYAGKLNFYLTLVDNKIRDHSDNPSIGLLLCEAKQGITVEYAIENIRNPLSISSYKLNKKLPKNLEGFLPNPDEIANSLEKKGRKNNVDSEPYQKAN